jgi:iron complex outermembrane recepter protein
MLKSMTFRSTLAAVACALSLSVHAMADGSKKVEIPAGDLRPALLQFSKIFGVELFYQPSQLDHFHTAGVKGSYTPEAAVRLLLKGTPLELRTDPSGAMMIIDPKAPRAAAVSALTDRAPTAATTGENSQSRSSLLLAQTSPTQTSGASPVAGQSVSSQGASSQVAGGLEEIVVTAQKREERLQDVPVPMTAISAESLAQSNLANVEDYYATVPGLSLSNSGYPGASTIAIRGITTAGGTPTVETTIDDVPVGNGSPLAVGGFFPSIDPSDLSHVEILRGPQGTLYGAASLGGLVKFVTADPATDAVFGRIQGHAESVSNGDGLGTGAGGGVNVPVTDTTAFRISGFTRIVPGYIDNPVLNKDGVNRGNSAGGLASFLWKPSEDLSVKLSALIQDVSADGLSTAQSGANGLGVLEQEYLRDVGLYHARTNLYTAVVHANVDGIKLTSVSGYSTFTVYNVTDFSSFLPTLVLPNEGEIKQFTQEIRLSSTIGHSVDWLIGGYFSNQDNDAGQQIFYTDPATGAYTSQFAGLTYRTPSTELAGMGDLTVHFTDRFNVQFGGRESRNKVVYNETDTGPYSILVFNEPVHVVPTGHSRDNSFTYLVTPQFRITPDQMVYARVASGYRPGGPNAGAAAFNLPLSFAPDKTTNYELGVKGDWLEHRLFLDSSIYYIDWKNLQISVIDAASQEAFTANAGDAKSEGAEVAWQARPFEGTTIDGWVVWNEAVLTQNFPASSTTAGNAGDPLPFSSRWSGNLSVQQERRLGAGLTALVRATGIYVGDRLSLFSSAPTQPRVVLPSYFQVNLLAGVHVKSWEINAYANNLTDKRGVVSRPNSSAATSADIGYLDYVYIQPRTVGLSLEYKF